MDKKVVVVYLPDEGEYGHIVREGAHASLISYTSRGISCEVFLPNEDFVVVDTIIIGVEEEY